MDIDKLNEAIDADGRLCDEEKREAYFAEIHKYEAEEEIREK